MGRKKKPTSNRICRRCGKLIEGANWLYCNNCHRLMSMCAGRVDGDYVYEMDYAYVQVMKKPRKVDQERD